MTVSERCQHVFRCIYFLLLNFRINYEQHRDSDTEKSAPELIRGGDKIRINTKETS